MVSCLLNLSSNALIILMFGVYIINICTMCMLDILISIVLIGL